MTITVRQFVEEFKEKKVQNTKVAPNAVEDFIKNKLEIKTYIPFEEKKKIVKMVVEQNITEDNGIKKVDSISQFIGFVVAMLIAYTNFDINKENPIEDYDLLCEAGLLECIMGLFKKDYDECNVLLKMALADELQDNNLGAIVGKFLSNISEHLDGFTEKLKGVVENIDIQNLLGGNFKLEDLAHLKGFLDTFNK